MDRTQKRCLTGSGLVHGVLLAVLVAGAAFAPKPEVFEGPVLEILPDELTLTDGNAAGGGSPTATKPVSPPPVAPTPITERPEQPPNRTAPKPTRPEPQRRTEPPPRKREPSPRVEEKPVKPVQQKRPEPSRTTAQDRDNSRPTKKPEIKVADRKSTRSPVTADDNRKAQEEARRREREEADARATIDRRNQAIEAANQARRDLARRLTSGAESISSGVGTSTVIEMPGPGGEAYAPYMSYLGSFYRLRWKNPRSTDKAHSYVGVSLEVAKDGTVLNWRLTDPSGLRDVDNSVRDVLKRYPKLRPFPAAAKDSRRIFTIQFRLDADSSL